MKTIEIFKGAINNGNLKLALVDFVSAICQESDLCDTYLEGHVLLAGRHFKLYCFKENRVYLYICFSIGNMGNSKT